MHENWKCNRLLGKTSPPAAPAYEFWGFDVGKEGTMNKPFGNLRQMRLSALVQELRKFHIVVCLVIIRFETDFFAEQEHDVFSGRRFGAVNLKSVVLKREAAAVVGFAVIFGGLQGVKVKPRGQGREGGIVLTGRFPVETRIEFPYETRDGGGEPVPSR
jgi:hypothetical protein